MGIWALIFGGMIPSAASKPASRPTSSAPLATMAVGTLICALAALFTLHVIRKREAQLGAATQRVGA